MTDRASLLADRMLADLVPARAKTLRLEPRPALSHDRASLPERKAEAIELHRRSGLSKRAFVRACLFRWETGRDYLDEGQPKKAPTARFLRIARNVVERIELVGEPLELPAVEVA